MKKGMGGNSGFALILTLVITALMVAIVVEMVHQVSVDVSLSRSFRDGQQASILAESGVTGGKKLLQMSVVGKDYISLSDIWAKPLKLEDEIGSLVITITDESGKVYINNIVTTGGTDQAQNMASVKLLGKRFKTPDAAWDALAGWINSNYKWGGATEALNYYRANGYNPRNGKLPTLNELTLIKGFTPELVSKMTPYITAYSPTGDICLVNINTAPPEVLAALDSRIDDRLAARIVSERLVGPFKATGELSGRVPGMEAIGPSLIGRIAVKSSLFRITSVAKVKEAVRTVETVVRLSGEPMSWIEY